MTPERIRANLAEVETRQAAVEAEGSVLAEIAAALRRLLALTESPGQPEPKDPAPAAERAVQANGGSIATTPAPAPSATADCPDCGRAVKRQGLGVHRARAHGVAGQGVRSKRRQPAMAGGRGKAPPALPGTPPAPEPVLRHGRESFLCSRCPEAFPDRERLLAHMAKGHPPESARPEPMRAAAGSGASGAVKLA